MKMRFRDMVREAQEAVANSEPGVFLVDADGFPMRDDVHFNTRGQLLLGEAFAAKLIPLLKAEKHPETK